MQLRSFHRFSTGLLLFPWQLAGHTTWNLCPSPNFYHHCLETEWSVSILCHHLSCDSTPTEGGASLVFVKHFSESRILKYPLQTHVLVKYFFIRISELCCFTTGLYTGSITYRFSAKEPALLPRRYGWTREDYFVSLSRSDNRPQTFVGHKLMKATWERN